MKKNMIRLVGIALAVALLSSFLFYRLLAGRLATEEAGSQPLVVAARKLEPGTTVTASDVKMAFVVGSTAIKDSFTARELAIGLTVIEAVETGQALTARQIVPRGSREAACSRIPPGMRVVTVHAVESSGILAVLRSGHRVDVHAVNPQGMGTQLRTVLQNIEVLAVNPQADGGGRGGPQVLTLLVKAEDAEALAVADSGAKIRLALRNPSDGSQYPARRLALAQVFDGTGGGSNATPQVASRQASAAAR